MFDFAFFFVFRKNFKNMVLRNDVVIKTAVQIVDKVIIKIIYSAVLQLLCKNTFNIFFAFNCPGWQFGGKRKAFARVAFYQRPAGKFLAFAVVINITGIK